MTVRELREWLEQIERDGYGRARVELQTPECEEWRPLQVGAGWGMGYRPLKVKEPEGA